MRLVQGLAATSAILAIMAGTPWLLISLAKLPGFLPSWEQITILLLSPDGGRFLLLLVWGAAWLLWAWLSVLILVETVALARGVKAPQLPAASLPQGLARGLVAAAAAAFISTPLHATATPPTDVPDTASPASSTALSQTAVASDTPRVTSDAVPTLVVVEGDTLWDLAEEHLGDPHRWDELFEANRGIPQPSGYALENPDEIDVGWTLRLPGQSQELSSPAEIMGEALDRKQVPGQLLPPDLAEEVKADVQPAEPRETAPIAILPEAKPVDANPTAPAPTPIRAETATAQDAEITESPRFAWQVAGLLGAGGFLGVGVAAALAARRRDQFRVRRPGRMISNPDPVVAPIEQSAQLATGLSARLVARLDQALRRLDPHTIIQAVEVDRDGSILVRTSTQLEPPWLQQPQGFRLEAAVPVDDVGEAVQDRSSPWPLLVTVGADADNRVILYNLEHQGVISVDGDPLMAADFLRYIAAELAVNPWSSDVRVACQGPAEAVVAMAPERLDAQSDEIAALARANAERTSSLVLSAAVARTTQAGDEAWTAGALITDDPTQTEALKATIDAHPEQSGTAVVVLDKGAGEWSLATSGRLRLPEGELTAVGLTQDEAAGCAALLAVEQGDSDAEPPDADDLTDVTGNLRPERRQDRGDDGAVESVLAEPDEEYLNRAAVEINELNNIAPRAHLAVGDELRNRDPELDAQVRQWFSPRCPYPRLSLLGPVTARTHGRPVAKQKAYYTEVLAFLALHPDGVTADQVAAAFGTTIQRARTVVSNLRSWLGDNPRTGDPHIPDAKNSALARERGIGLYIVEDLLVDADLFRRLRSRGVTGGRDGIEDLEAALQLVSGRPFDQLRPAGWTWLIEGDRTDQHMVCAVSDVAHILTTHHLQVGDLEAAKRAVTVALHADPDSETARLDLAAIMVQEGHGQSARRIVTEALGENADLDLTPRAVEILTGKDWLKSGGSVQPYELAGVRGNVLSCRVEDMRIWIRVTDGLDRQWRETQ